MRPTDENQRGSTRPNLMSSARRSANDDNILAMLERDGRGRPSLWPRARTVWYGFAGSLVVALIGTLTWLVWDNGAPRTPSDDPVRSAPAPMPRVAVPQPPPALVLASPPSPAETGENAPPLQGAAIIDSPALAAPPAQMAQDEMAGADLAPPLQPVEQDAPATLQQSAPPALVLLAADEAAPAQSAAMPPAPPARSQALTATARPAAAVPKAATAARRPARSATARARKQQGAPSQPQSAGEAGADSDVALISAIIMHSSAHAAERARQEAAANCSADNCPSTPAKR